MAGVIVFLDKTPVPNNLTEIHFFEDDRELIRFSGANLHRRHLVREVPAEAWHRMGATPTPAVEPEPDTGTITIETADEPEQTPWHCVICGKPVRLTNDLQPWHLDGPANHEAELSQEELKTLADGLRMSD